MKTTLALVTGLMAVVGSAHAMDNVALVNEIALAQINAPGIMNVINWKVGEFQDLNLTLSGFSIGTMHKEAKSEEGNGVWMSEVTAGSLIGNHTIEVLIDRADGHVIKMKQDGKDTTPPDDKLEIINQETATVTVPAGTFETIHITAKSEKSGNVEVWANPQAITLDGTAKLNATAQGMPLSMELTKFGGK